MKKIFIAIAILFILLPISHVSAKIVFTEIMYDPSGSDTHHEWVELYNDGTDPVTISGGSSSGSWRFYDGGNHYLSATATQGSMTINGGEYTILADDPSTFLIDYPNFTGSIIDTIINLPNTSGTVKIVDGSGVVIDSVDYSKDQGGYDDGNSLQKKSDGAWIAALPTPGAMIIENQSNNSSSDNATSTTDTTTQTISSSSGGSSGTSAGLVPVVQKILMPEAVLSSPKVAVAGIPIEISTSILNTQSSFSNEKAFHVALGDGTENNSPSASTFSHVYKYPGTYVIYFKYQSNQYSNSSNLSTRRIIEVVPPSVIISDVERDGAIKITNTSNREADISGWSIHSLIDPTFSFLIPSDTNILAGKTIFLPKEITGMPIGDTRELYLSLPLGNIVSIYDRDEENKSIVENEQPVQVLSESVSIQKIQEIPKISYSEKSLIAVNSVNEKSAENISTNTANEPPDISPNIQEEKVKKVKPLPIAISLLILFGIIGITAFVLKKLNLLSPQKRIEKINIVEDEPDQKISVDDIRILE